MSDSAEYYKIIDDITFRYDAEVAKRSTATDSRSVPQWFAGSNPVFRIFFLCDWWDMDWDQGRVIYYLKHPKQEVDRLS